MRRKQDAAVGVCLLAAACSHEDTRSEELGVSRDALIPGFPATIDARLVERSDGTWRAQCLGRFRKLGAGDTKTYQAFVTFLEEGQQKGFLGGAVSPAAPTLSKTALGRTLTITHPSVDPAGSVTVRMMSAAIDPKRLHSCQVVIKQDNSVVMRSGGRIARHFSNPTGVFVDSGQALGSFTWSVALGDLDGDGDVDVFEGTTFGNRVRVNNGSGILADTGQTLGNHATLVVALGDLDGDGDLDMFHGTSAGQPDRVWLNNGSGVFTDTGQTLGNQTTFCVALGDLDGDGHLDAFTGTYNLGNHIWLNNGSGSLTNSGQNVGYHSTRSVALGDVDGDGDLDAFLGNSNQAKRVWLNNGGVFTDSGQALAAGDTRSVALGDLDGDGDLDAFEGRAYQINPGSRVWRNNGSGTFTDTGQSLGNHNTRSVALGDLDGDGDLDAFQSNHMQANRVWLNNGSGTFSNSFQALGNHSSESVALGDLDNDGDLDAFEGNSQYGEASRVWRNQ